MADLTPTGASEARYLAFLETVATLRPGLHRYCARMTGSRMDGEDVAQEALFQAYRRLDSYDDSRPLGPWVFRIAHNRCIDFLRQRGVREDVEADAAPESDEVAPIEAEGSHGEALEHLVVRLPPKERACVLLKDVFDHSLAEIAELVDSTVGGVKAALNRGRSKLAGLAPEQPTVRPQSQEESELLRLYVERFNQQDWSGLRELISADARLTLADRFFGRLDQAPYFSTYQRMSGTWRMAVGTVENEPAVVIEQPAGAGWVARAAMRLRVAGGKIVEITDYWYCPWILPNAAGVSSPRSRP